MAFFTSDLYTVRAQLTNAAKDCSTTHPMLSVQIEEFMRTAISEEQIAEDAKYEYDVPHDPSPVNYSTSLNNELSSLQRLTERLQRAERLNLPPNHEYDYHLSAEDRVHLHRSSIVLRFIQMFKPHCFRHPRPFSWRNHAHMNDMLHVYGCKFESMKQLGQTGQTTQRRVKYIMQMSYSFEYNEIKLEFDTKPLIVRIVVYSNSITAENNIRLTTFYFQTD